MKIEVTNNLAKADIETVSKGLEQHSVNLTPPYEKQELGVFVRDGDGNLLGGLTGSTLWGWLYIKLLWVDDGQRGTGLGRRLVQSAEEEAVRRGCFAAYVNTFSYQAPDFYEKLGYQVFGQLDDFPQGYQRVYLNKRLTTFDTSPVTCSSRA